MKTRNKPIILLIAEAVTLAHFGRIVTLAKALDPAVYEVIIASDPRYLHLEAPLDCAFRSIRSIPSAEFAAALSQGKPLYSIETLTRYVEDDLALLDSIKPDLVIGDFRLSLAVSVPLRGIPYAAVVNAYWSPYSDVSYPIPDLQMTRILGVRLAQKLFDIVRPMAFALHAKPMNQLRQHFGLPSLGRDLRSTYTWADYTLYADIPEVVPTRNLPTHHRYLGPVLWSAEVPLPEWWNCFPKDKPLVFLTLGSSGEAELLPMALSVLSHLAITVIVATAGRITLADAPPNAYITDYLPVDMAIRCSQIVISNGGSLTTYQALASGVPIIGLCSNMDQLLSMNSVQRLGAGIMLRAASLSAANLLDSVTAMLNNPAYAQAASKVSLILSKSDAGQRLREFVAEILAKVTKVSK
ncbi:UDP:flavonoid glycosyltransferase YjiC, YdhE family [Nitrosospira sp. Nl5]|uniref:glycosyltransferase n=1 Tax=Nitrosospira sp. Nl5 TaxID=200120 RepID=UPI00088F4590|nr:glycosyltransferase [Nitrosospira sp. Nl5]SCY55573.1 UDP:flavonoid glycosyltransferase YjiC, YdhE family [Nitrosospira sp. Nl5]